MTSEAKQILLDLEKTGKFLFHGSGDIIELFEPRQAHNYINGQQIEDDLPGVHASPKAEIAIFMAIINKNNCPLGYESSFTISDEGVTYSATKDTLSQLTKPTGYVYVFQKDALFVKRSSLQYICYSPIKPIKYVIVGKEDLPSHIDLIT